MAGPSFQAVICRRHQISQVPTGNYAVVILLYTGTVCQATVKHSSYYQRLLYAEVVSLYCPG